MPTTGIGTSRRSRPGPGPVLTRASIGQWPPISSSSSSVEPDAFVIVIDVDQSMIGFSTEPMPSISQRTRSPGSRIDRRVAEDPDPGRRPGGDDVAGLERDRAG